MVLTPTHMLSSTVLSEHEQQRLTEVLAHSEPLQAFLRANLTTQPRRYESQVLKELLCALENEKNPQAWISNPNLLVYLPVVIRFHDLPQMSPSDTRYITAEIMSYSALKSRNWNSLFYPLFLAILTFVFLIAIGLFITPIFGEIYRDFSLRLPMPTELLVGFSNLLIRKPILVPLVTLSVLLLFTSGIYGFNFVLRHLQQFAVIGFWVAGSRRNVEDMTKWLAVLTELLHLDFPLEKALPIAAVASHSIHLELVSRTLAMDLRQVREGTKPKVDATITAALPATVMTALFGNHPTSTTLLRQIVTANHIRIQERQGTFGGLLGPITTIVMGLIVGFTIVALFLPLISMLRGLSF